MTEQADLVLKGGRILDPESGLDEIQDIAFKDGKVSANHNLCRCRKCRRRKLRGFSTFHRGPQ